MKKDLVDEVIEERTRANPDFPVMVEASSRARALLKELAKRRSMRGLSQTVVAARMGTSQSALARLEGGDSDPRLSTVERYVLAIGEDLSITGITPADEPRSPAAELPKVRGNGDITEYVLEQRLPSPKRPATTTLSDALEQQRADRV